MPQLNFSQLVERAYLIVKEHRTIWWLGLLSALGGGIAPGVSNVFSSTLRSKPPMPIDRQAIESFISHHMVALSIGAAVLFVLLLLAVFLGVCARAGIIIATNDIEEGRQPTFGQAFRAGRRFFWRIFGFQLFLLMLLAIMIGFVVLLLVLFYVAFWPLGILMTVLLAPVLIATVLAVGTMGHFAICSMVLHNQSITEALESSWQLLIRNGVTLLLLLLVNVGVIIVAQLLITLAIFVMALLLVGVGLLLALASVGLAIGYAIVVGLALLLCAFFLSGLMVAWGQAYWTLAYRAVSYLDKQK